MTQVVKIFTDGACRGNPGRGGWGAVLQWRTQQKEIKGATQHTTNNQMELQAAIEALATLKKPCKVILTTDSKYVKNGITEWLPRWKKRNWQTVDKKPVKNVTLWQRLEQETMQHEIEWHWIRGHTGHVENERADQLANQAIDELIRQRESS